MTDDLERGLKTADDAGEVEVLENVMEGRGVLDITPIPERMWFFYPNLLKLNLLLLPPLLAQIVSGFDASMMNNLQAVNTWEEYFNFPTGGRLGTMVNGMTIGTLISTPFVSVICDYFGRKKALIAGCTIIVIGAIVQGSAQNFGAFTAGRIILGIGSCLESTAAGPFLSECTYPTHRVIMTGFLLASWPIGAFISTLVTWGTYFSPSTQSTTWSWRIPSLLEGVIPLFQIAIAIFGPESPRWLVNKGRIEEARKFFTKYHANGDNGSLLVNFQMAEIEATLEAEKAQKLSNWKHWISTKAMRHRFFIVSFLPAMLQLEGNDLVSYYLHIILDNMNITKTLEQLKINVGLTAWSVVVSLVVVYFSDKFRRRTIFLSGLIGMTICFVIWTILSAIDQERNFMDKSLSIGVIAFIYLDMGFVTLPAIISTPYIMEVAPYSLRASASMIYQLTGNIAGLFNNYVNPIAMDAITWRYYIVYCCWLPCLAAIVYFFFPETSGRGLEEVDSVFGGGLHAGVDALKEKGGKVAIGEKSEINHHQPS